MSVYTKLACFAGGALFGSFGVKILSSKDWCGIKKVDSLFSRIS